MPTGHSAVPIQAVVSTARLATADSTRGRGDRRIDLCSQAHYCQAIFQDNRELCNWAGQVSNWWRGGGRSLIAAAHCLNLACALPTDRKQPVAGETSKLTECARDHGLINNRRARKQTPKPRAGGIDWMRRGGDLRGNGLGFPVRT